MKIVLVVDPVISKIITSLALAERLRADGHDVSVRVPPGRVELEALEPLGLAVDLPDLRIDPPERLAPSVDTVTEYQNQLDAEGATLHLIDAEAHEYVLAAVAAGLPVALLNVFFNLWKLPGVPPVHQNVMPGIGWRGSRAGIEYGWWGYRVFRLRDIVRSMALGNDRRHHLRTFAAGLGLDPAKTLTEFHGMIPFQYRNLRTLTLNLPELELPGAVHRLNHYAGPMPSRSTVGMDADQEQEVLADVEALRAAHPDRKLIYAAFGAYYDGDDRAFWRRAVETVGARPDWLGVFGLGGRLQPEDLGPLPANVRVYSWAPQLGLLEQADCAVIHAGMTSVYECLHHTVPMVVFPLGDSFDQYGTAARVAHHQLGAVGDRETATVSDIQALIDQVIDDEQLAAKLHAFKATMEQYEAPGALTAVIERLLRP